jgi:limonene-1,2-epoxide hydrolase
MDHLAATAGFFDRWATSFDGMCSSFTDVFGPDCVWDQRPMARTTGPHEALRFLRVCRRTLGLDTIEVEMVSAAVTGSTVHTQRVDHLRRADGGLIASAPVAGVLVWRDDRLVHWTEYFDAGSLGARAAVSGAGVGARALVTGAATLAQQAGRLLERRPQ